MTRTTDLPTALRADKAIPPSARTVTKRDGTSAPFDRNKIVRAIALAIHDARSPDVPNPYRDDPLAQYGVRPEFYHSAAEIADDVEKMLDLWYREGETPAIEQIQDSVEKAIAVAGLFDVAKAFIIYRARHAELRIAKYADNGLADYIAVGKYARYREDLGRRETFVEGVRRVRDMHLTRFSPLLAKRFPGALADDVKALAGDQAALIAEHFAGKDLGHVIQAVFDQVEAKYVLPSMRSMQFGGKACLANPARMYNCSFSNVDRISFFREYFFLLLSGCGCGFSVQRHHVARLPALPQRAPEADLEVRHYEIADTIQGWGDVLHELFTSFLEGYKVEFSYRQIRPRGAPLKTSGGKAPGHLPLKRALGQIEGILSGASGRQLRPIEVYDICMYASKAVLAGGVRRSATICLFSPDDAEMMGAKTGDWFQSNPQRAASNNSAVLPRGDGQRELFLKLFEAQKQFGEPGFFFCDDPDAGTNPCAEIGLMPVLENPTEEDVQKLYAYGYDGELPSMTRLSGFQQCNLTTINGAAATSEAAFYRACIAAAAIGTLQAAYTDIPYLGPVTRVINEKDALLGVSICGFMDQPEILFNPAVLTAGARLCRAVNRVVAAHIGINPAARVTCVKPEGTASLLLGAASGIHPHHARRYFRRVQANRKEPVYAFFKSTNPQMTEKSVYGVDTDDVITFPVEAGKTAVTRDQLTAVEFLALVQRVQQAWVLPGTDPSNRTPAINHNVSNTVTVKPEEWSQAAEVIWSRRQFFTGIALLAAAGDKDYPQSPREEVVGEPDIAKWNALQPKPVDYTKLIEFADATTLADVVACAGNGACELNLAPTGTGGRSGTAGANG
jgi:ribonucleoside-diphosphate reductase alpha chain